MTITALPPALLFSLKHRDFSALAEPLVKTFLFTWPLCFCLPSASIWLGSHGSINHWGVWTPTPEWEIQEFTARFYIRFQCFKGILILLKGEEGVF